MRILTMLTVLSFCGNIFAQNSARESAFGTMDMKLSTYNNNSYTCSPSDKSIDRTAGDYAVAMAALPRELVHSIPTSEFVASLKSPITSSSYIVVNENIDFARAMAVYSPEMARQMAGLFFTKKTPSHQLAKVEEKSNS